MGFTNTTAHYSLPQYLATDKPKYLTDFNQTMEAIDTQMYTNAQAAATADGKAVAAKDVADGAVSSIGTLNTQINGDALDPSDRGLAGDVSDNSGAINTINSLIGNGEPTTSDKTIIGAINEIYADITGGGTDVSAGNVSYDNTTSGLTADDVQEAIDEVYAAIPSVTTPDAEDISYDNTTSGLTASNVQAAIDELAGASPANSDIIVTGTLGAASVDTLISADYKSDEYYIAGVVFYSTGINNWLCEYGNATPSVSVLINHTGVRATANNQYSASQSVKIIVRKYA